MPKPATSRDILVIGSGGGGATVVARLARAGATRAALRTCGDAVHG